MSIDYNAALKFCNLIIEQEPEFYAAHKSEVDEFSNEAMCALLDVKPDGFTVNKNNMVRKEFIEAQHIRESKEHALNIAYLIRVAFCIAPLMLLKVNIWISIATCLAVFLVPVLGELIVWCLFIAAIYVVATTSINTLGLIVIVTAIAFVAIRAYTLAGDKSKEKSE